MKKRDSTGTTGIGTSAAVKLATYDAADKCVECGGGRADHEFHCPAVERAARCGIPLGRRFAGGAVIELKP